MKLFALPAFADNAIRMVRDAHDALTADPGNLLLVGILVTHPLANHVGNTNARGRRLQTPVGALRNPFPRCREPAAVEAGRREGASDDSPVAVFTAPREWKNSFR